MWAYLLALVRDPVVVEDASQLRLGRVIVTGTVRTQTDTLKSPVRGIDCVAYHYRTTWTAPARGKKALTQLRAAEVYMPRFVLELDGGEIAVTGRSDAPVTVEEHQAAARVGLDGFKATELVIKPQDRIRVVGWARREGDGWTLTPSELDMVEPHVPVPPRRVRRSRRRVSR